jgi:hypothetical protein
MRLYQVLREVYGEHSSSHTVVFEWHSHFKAGQMSVEDDERLKRPSTSKTEVCQEFLTENLNIHHIATKFAPRLLTNDQKQQCVNMCLEL